MNAPTADSTVIPNCGQFIFLKLKIYSYFSCKKILVYLTAVTICLIIDNELKILYFIKFKLLGITVHTCGALRYAF